MSFEGPYRVEMTDAVDTVRRKIVLPFVPSKMEVYNNDTGSKTNWMRSDDGTQDGGLMSIGADTVTELTTTTGLNLVTTPIVVKYNDPATPTYQDQDGNAIVASQIVDIDGEDWLTRFLPKSVAGDTNFKILGVHVELPLQSENANIRDDDDILVLIAWP